MPLNAGQELLEAIEAEGPALAVGRHLSEGTLEVRQRRSYPQAIAPTFE